MLPFWTTIYSELSLLLFNPCFLVSPLRSPRYLYDTLIEVSVKAVSVGAASKVREPVLKPYSFQHLGTFPREGISGASVVVCHHSRENCRDETRKIQVRGEVRDRKSRSTSRIDKNCRKCLFVSRDKSELKRIESGRIRQYS